MSKPSLALLCRGTAVALLWLAGCPGPTAATSTSTGSNVGASASGGSGTGGRSGSGGGTTTGGSCLIGGVTVAPGGLNPAGACLVCNPSLEAQAWVGLPDGTTCAGGSCHSGVCVPTACASCDGATTGLCAPLSTCSAAASCDDGSGAPPITTAETQPSCSTNSSQASVRGAYQDPIRSWTDPVSQEQRSACVFQPTATGDALPLLLFFHGSLSSANMVYNETSLRTKALSFPLGQAGTTGFALAALQGSNLHWPDTHNEGAHFDFFFRSEGSPSLNPDVRAVDELIDTLVAGGGIDPQRIFVSGWSNGAFFAEQYAFARFDTATPGGNKIAAAAVYAGGDPFNATAASQSPSCQLSTYPTDAVPLLLMHRSCDAQVGCNEGQAQAFNLLPGFYVEEWLNQLPGTKAAATTLAPGGSWQSGDDLLLDDSGAQTGSCEKPASCALAQGNTNHHAWPDGIADGSGVDWEPTLLSFLAAHPRP